MPDSVGTSNLIDDANFGNALTLIPGIIGNGIQPTAAFSGSCQCLNWHNADLTSVSQTYRFWFMLPSSNSTVTLQSPFCIIIPKWHSAAFTVEVDITGNQNQLAFSNVTPFAGVNPAIWHYLLLAIDYPNQVATLILDNQVPVAMPLGLGFPYLVPALDPPNIGARNFGLGFNALNFAAQGLDEVAVWKGLLSAAELTADYNGGAGRTYPF